MKKHPKWISDEKVLRICDLLLTTNMTIADIARKENVSRVTVHNIFNKTTHKNITKKFDFTDRKGYYYHSSRRYSDEKIREVCELLENTSKSYVEIAELTDVEYEFVYNTANGYYSKITSNYKIDPDLHSGRKRNKYMTFEQMNRIESLIRLGTSTTDIFSIVDVPRIHAVYEFISRYRRKVQEEQRKER